MNLRHPPCEGGALPLSLVTQVEVSERFEFYGDMVARDIDGDTDVDVAIVGGGMIGLASACLLLQQGFRVCLIDRAGEPRWTPSARDQSRNSRVSALNAASCHLLDHIGVWQNIGDNSTPYRSMKVWDSHSNANIDFDASDVNALNLGYIVENDLVSATMLERLKQNYAASFYFHSNVVAIEHHAESVSLKLDNPEQQIRCRLVVAADGGQSTLRVLAGISVDTESFTQNAIVARIKCERQHQHTAWQCFTPAGPIALLPMQGNFCSLVWSADRDLANELMALDDEAFCIKLQSVFGERLGSLQLAAPRGSFPLYSRHAQQYIAPNLALVGDAAHTTHPLAGLGANIGFQDAACLAEVVEAAQQSGKGYSSHAVLRRYERWRKGENQQVLVLMKAFKQLFGSTDSGVQQFRQTAFSLADRITPLKSEIIRHAMGVAGDLPLLCRQSRNP